MIDVFAGKRILITGGTGSLGKKMTEALLRDHHPRELVIFSRDEFKQFEMAQRWSQAKYSAIRYMIGDVRDPQRLRRAFSGMDFVLHAAALKQVPTAEDNPSECIRTNVLGAMNVIEACLETGVERVVALSTDKACNPVNLYGATKLCSDKLFVAANGHAAAGRARFSVVRYGNVIGSRGSVVPFFRERAKTGKLPITDARMTRFWITLEQAVECIVRAFTLGRGGEIFVPKIPSVRITDLARAIAPECSQEIVGIRPGEKVHELLISRDDVGSAVEFPGYYVVAPPVLRAQLLSEESTGKACAADFEYCSGTNERFLGVEELRTMLATAGTPFAADSMHWTLDEVPR